MNVLSGSSTRKIAPKTMAMVARSKSISRRLYPRRPNTLTGCPTPRPSPWPRSPWPASRWWWPWSPSSASAGCARQLRVLEGQRPVGTGDLAALRADIAQALRHVAVVRYDAFGDMGGRLSFSAAVIDDRGDGLVFSSIHARGESRTYAKGIVGGGSDATLTPEEQQALAAARTGSQGA